MHHCLAVQTVIFKACICGFRVEVSCWLMGTRNSCKGCTYIRLTLNLLAASHQKINEPLGDSRIRVAYWERQHGTFRILPGPGEDLRGSLAMDPPFHARPVAFPQSPYTLKDLPSENVQLSPQPVNCVAASPNFRLQTAHQLLTKRRQVSKQRRRPCTSRMDTHQQGNRSVP